MPSRKEMSEIAFAGPRRDFLRAVGTAAAAGAALSTAVRPLTASPQTQSGGKPLRVGLIGCGGRGNTLLRSVSQLIQQGEPAEIAAVCDIYQPRLERTATRFQAKSFGNAGELVRDPGIDAVIIATPDRVHVFNALDAIRAGKDVYCEKPLVHWQQLDKLKELRQAAREHRTVFQVGAQWVSDPIWEQSAKLIKDGGIGKPVHAQTGYFRRGDGGERGMPIDDPNARPGVGLDWDAFQADAPRQPFSISRFFQWRMYMDYSGGPPTDLYAHPLTRLLKALDPGMPETVVAIGGRYRYNGERDVPDTFDMLIGYRQGLSVSVLGTIINDTGIETVVRGTEGTLTFPGEGKTEISIEPQPDTNGRARSVSSKEYVLDHMKNFLSCVRTRQTPVGDIELGFGVQLALIMAMQSYVNGKVARYDAANEEILLS